MCFNTAGGNEGKLSSFCWLSYNRKKVNIKSASNAYHNLLDIMSPAISFQLESSVRKIDDFDALNYFVPEKMDIARQVISYNQFPQKHLNFVLQ